MLIDPYVRDLVEYRANVAKALDALAFGSSRPRADVRQRAGKLTLDTINLIHRTSTQTAV